MGFPSGWFVRRPALSAALATILLLWVVGVAFGDDDPPAPSPDAAAAGPDDERSPKGRDRDHRAKRGSQPSGRGTEVEATPPPRPRSSPAPRRPQQTFLVTRIIDGDTVELGNGKTVRLVGIDTPEVGECGFEAASNALAVLLLDKKVRLTVSDEDKDQYGRLLRYVDIGTMDSGLRLVKRGLAIARYDSRDGYGHHPRQGFYIKADAASEDFSCPKPVPFVGGGSAGTSCAAGYDPCIPPYPPDLDCGDLDGPIAVTGSDPHGLDADGDGWACET